MMEENGGWIVGDAQRRDAEMADAMIEVTVEASRQIS